MTTQQVAAWFKTWPGIVSATVAALTVVGAAAITAADVVQAPAELRMHHEILFDSIMPELDDLDSLRSATHELGAQVSDLQSTLNFHSRLLCEIADIPVRDCTR